jgi:hypothetical protein
MKIRIEVTPDSVGQVLDDLRYADGMTEGREVEIISPFTRKLLQDVAEAAEEKAVSMVKEGSEFSDIFAGHGGDIISVPEEPEGRVDD